MILHTSYGPMTAIVSNQELPLVVYLYLSKLSGDARQTPP